MLCSINLKTETRVEHEPEKRREGEWGKVGKRVANRVGKSEVPEQVKVNKLLVLRQKGFQNGVKSQPNSLAA